MATPILTPTARQRQAQAAVAAGIGNPWRPTFGSNMGGANMSLSMPMGAGSGPTFMRTAPSLAQQTMAARAGATGLMGPTYQSMAGAASEPSPLGGTFGNFATLEALARGFGRNREWARGQLRQMRSSTIMRDAQQAAQKQAMQQQAQQIRAAMVDARRKGDMARYDRLVEFWNQWKTSPDRYLFIPAEEGGAA